MQRSPLTIGFDIGGTNLRAGVVDSTGSIIDMRAALTPATDEELVKAITAVVDDLRTDHPSIAAVGLAVAGFLNPECTVVRFAPHLPLVDFPLHERLTEELGLPVRLEHDANSAAWGEHIYGSGRGMDTWVLFAVGTGIGAALISGGEIYRGAFGTAPEFGHVQVVPDGRACSCGKRGCLERYVSGTALVETAAEIAARNVVREGSAVPADLASGPEIMAAARRGDPIAEETVGEFADWLGTGLSMVADVLDPEGIVVAGGVSLDADLYLDRAVERMAASMVGAGHRPQPSVHVAKLGAQAGIVGVAHLAHSMLEA